MILGVLSLWFGGACGGPQLPDREPDISASMVFRADKCTKSARAKPLMIYAPPSRNSDIEEVRKKGLIAVRYNCQHVEVLTDCNLEGHYDYIPVSVDKYVLTFKNEAEIKANIAYFGPSVGASLASDKQMNVGMAMIGKYSAGSLNVSPNALRQPECKGATHLIRGIYVGAFVAGLGEQTSGSMDAAMVFGASFRRKMSELRSGGDHNKCTTDHNTTKPAADCDKPIRLELVAVGVSHVNNDANVPTGNKTARMIHIPAGSFTMGSTVLRGEQQEMPLNGYRIDAYEVTVDEYAECVKTQKCSKPKMGEYYNWNVSSRGRHPINGVDWNQAVAYCAWAGKRLPTEAEWEKAARGTDGRTYPWGEDKPNCSRTVTNDGERGCGKNRTWEVGSKPRGVSPYGVHDMAGNVWEWTADWYSQSYPWSAPKRNPKGPESGPGRVLRGGSWSVGPLYLRAADRRYISPSVSDFNFGFRCAKSN